MNDVIALMTKVRAGMDPLTHVACAGGSVQSAMGQPTGDKGQILSAADIARELAALLRGFADEADQIT
ncbi:hypothetical protein ACFL0L_00545 [Patescibacteria group bacterium]